MSAAGAAAADSRGSFDLTGKVAIVTGAARGIGAGVARVLAEAGAKVVIADITLDRAQVEAERLVADGLVVVAEPLDLTQEESVVAFCAKVRTAHGAPWILVNNACLQDREHLLEATAAEWDRTEAVNARGPFLMTREVARAMVAAGQGGRIVNISSTALTGQSVKGHAAYTASKGAILGLSHASAMELVEHGVTVNIVMPGGVGTEGAIAAKGPPVEGPGCRPPPLGRPEPKDIAAAVLFFASPAARRITNQILKVDGGFSVT